MKQYFCALIALLIASAAHAQCNTAPTCTNDATNAHATPVLVDVLANDMDDGQALDVDIISNTCNVPVAVDSYQLVELSPTPQQPIKKDCLITYRATDEPGLSDTAIITVKVITAIFGDGFESGNTSRWTETVTDS